ncbi:hypothetical protein OF83DRAFT_1175343 [Amylostereum chailletii]|nr:hypothetical protein OF83DRAFT_1175343 [Amylostereum chailletii]
MPIPITCNSLGDIVAITQIVLQLVTALNETTGSPAEYRAFALRVQSLYGTLQHTIAIVQTLAIKELSTENVCEPLFQEIEGCVQDMERAWSIVTKYKTTLGDGSGGRVKRTISKTQWFLTKGKVNHLKMEIFERQQIIANILVSIIAHTTTDIASTMEKMVEIMQDIREDAVKVTRRSQHSVLDMLRQIMFMVKDIPNHVGQSRINEVSVIDVLGIHYWVPFWRCPTYEEFHRFMLGHFDSKRAGREYIESRAYEVALIANNDNSLVIDPKAWAISVLRSGWRWR